MHANGQAGAARRESDNDQDEVAQLSIRLAEREGQLQATKQQVQELEAIHELAQVRVPCILSVFVCQQAKKYISKGLWHLLGATQAVWLSLQARAVACNI